MIGVLVTLESGIVASGVIFPDDNNIYVHAPICDTWASQEDFLAATPGASVKPVGPVVPYALAIEQVKEDYQRNKTMLQKQYKQTQATMKEQHTTLLNDLEERWKQAEASGVAQ